MKRLAKSLSSNKKTKKEASFWEGTEKYTIFQHSSSDEVKQKVRQVHSIGFGEFYFFRRMVRYWLRLVPQKTSNGLT
ncbi:hypothetical protein [Parabacteroides provencensis]|uniref:hypothetical protein n=1 Tax=Parabacteroides provencensis TaxID=1944636 RepID=UPI000C14E66D|nr:hypothetical protein [Parabacteroides provencensis]